MPCFGQVAQMRFGKTIPLMPRRFENVMNGTSAGGPRRSSSVLSWQAALRYIENFRGKERGFN
jgi:hypothetical protein